MRRDVVATDTLMPWVCFTANFDWQPPGARWMIAYKAGSVHLVKRIVAEKAIKESKAKAIERPEHRKTSHASR